MSVSEIGRLGGKARRRGMSAQQWSAFCRAAVGKRWAKRRNPRGPDGKFIVK